VNDTWAITNIDLYPNNSIYVFNRWGTKITEIKGYDNKGRSWPSDSDAAKLIPGTYFYIIDPGDGSKLLKGWVEMIGK
jgi:gliding motility-associated-like protein